MICTTTGAAYSAAEPKALTGKIAFSYMFLDEIGRPTRTLDGKTVMTQRGT